MFTNFSCCSHAHTKKHICHLKLLAQLGVPPRPPSCLPQILFAPFLQQLFLPSCYVSPSFQRQRLRSRCPSDVLSQTWQKAVIHGGLSLGTGVCKGSPPALSRCRAKGDSFSLSSQLKRCNTGFFPPVPGGACPFQAAR